MVVIRLARGGAKKRPFYHLVVTDKRNSRDGRFIEKLGFYNPIAKDSESEAKIELDRVDYWLGVGAQASDRVRDILKKYRKQEQTAAA